jgi:hypothetical protein
MVTFGTLCGLSPAQVCFQHYAAWKHLVIDRKRIKIPSTTLHYRYVKCTSKIHLQQHDDEDTHDTEQEIVEPAETTIKYPSSTFTFVTVHYDSQ